MKKCFGLIILTFFLVSCSPKNVIKLTFTEKFEGLTQLVLASQTANVDFVEDVSKRVLGVFASHAKVKVTSNVSFDFYLDFQAEGYEASLDQKTKTLYFTAPPVRVKKPVINTSTVSYPETGLLVNEPMEAVRILESLTDRFISEGLDLLKEEKVQQKCTQQLTEFLQGWCSELGHKVENVQVNFREDTD